ncbi:MAG: Hpt domain-containing protein [Proteobacteria bacterium]|nr:Hpt domain-containing protein [Pseudomonadota bacterium]
MDTSKYKKIYLEEAHTHLSGIESALLSLGTAPDEVDHLGHDSTIDNLFRHYHTLKGMSASMGYDAPKELAHVHESLLSKLREGEISVTDSLVETLLDGFDVLKELISIVEEESDRTVDCTELIKRVEAAGEPAPEESSERAAPESATAAATGTSKEPLQPEPQPRSNGESPARQLRLSKTMKVESSVFDELLTTVGDLYMELSSFRNTSSTSGTPGTIAFKDSVFSFGKTLKRLHTSILTARMLPVASLTEALPRVVHDLARSLGKEVELRVETGNISLDRSILENLGGPLLHIIRNSVDHGIELPEERTGAGKRPRARITLRAYPKREQVVVEIADDGRGMDVERIKAKAKSAGYSLEQLSAMTRSELLMLVCIPGFSTSAEVTETSGRGVGMDVVKNSIEAIGGTLAIDSTEGAGTTITMELPRTTAIIKALFVSLSDELFLIPISKVMRVVEASAVEVGSGTYTIDDIEVPLVSLAPALGIENDTKKEQYAIVIVEADRTIDEADSGTQGPALAGIVVDDFGLEIDAYIKPLSPPMTHLPGVSGITVTGDGRPVFLVDVAQVTSSERR